MKVRYIVQTKGYSGWRKVSFAKYKTPEDAERNYNWHKQWCVDDTRKYRIVKRTEEVIG